MSQTTVRPVAQRFYNDLMRDRWPSSPAVFCDFGLRGDANFTMMQRYQSLHTAVRRGGVTLEQLDAALGDGPALTKLVNVPTNPHQGITFVTDWDFIAPELK